MPHIVSRTGGFYCPREGGADVKNREKQRANRRAKHQEEMLDKRNACGVKDLTAYNAVARMKLGDKATIKLT